MGGTRPFFVTGANAKIKVNGKTLAFCTDLSYSITILTQNPKVLGLYEGTSVEPLGYSVAGSFTVIRYVKDAAKSIGGKLPQGVAPDDAGNGVGNWGTAWGSTPGFVGRLGLGNDGRANEALDPSRYAAGTTFDIQVYQKTPTGDLGVANIRGARIISANFSISKKGVAMQHFEFAAQYVDEDSFAADASGKGQNFNT